MAEVAGEVDELQTLAKAKGADILPYLSSCPLLLQRLPTGIFNDETLPTHKTRALYLAMHEVVKRAYADCLLDAKDKLAHDTMAAAAIIGLVTETPGAYAIKAREERASRAEKRQQRFDIAGAWLDTPITGRWVSDREKILLGSFYNALLEALADERMMRLIALQVSGEASRQLVLGDVALPGRETTAHNSGLASSPYVRREAYERHFASLLEDGHMLIAFTGLSGMGKTTLAKHLATSEGGAVATVIRLTAGQLDTRDIQTALRARGIDAREAIDQTPLGWLALLLTDANAPQFVVLDNLESAEELANLLPATCISTVIATCITEGAAPPPLCRLVPVRHMLPSEAAELVTQYLPTVQGEAVSLLVSTLHGYPLALVYACAVIKRGRVSVEQFCADMKDSVASLDIHARADGQRLSTVLAQIANMIEKQDRLAFDLLACLSTTGGISGATLHAFLFHYLGINYNPYITKTRYEEALEVLWRASLVEYSNEHHIALHPHAWKILRVLFRYSVLDIGQNALWVASLYSHVKQNYSGDEAGKSKFLHQIYLDTVRGTIHEVEIYCEVLAWQARNLNRQIETSVDERGLVVRCVERLRFIVDIMGDTYATNGILIPEPAMAVIRAVSLVQGK